MLEVRILELVTYSLLKLLTFSHPLIFPYLELVILLRLPALNGKVLSIEHFHLDFWSLSSLHYCHLHPHF